MTGSFEFVRAARGPVLLIVVGILFALDQAGQWGFERTWPVLFIVYGVLKLIERVMAPPPPPAYYPPQGQWQPPAQGGIQS